MTVSLITHLLISGEIGALTGTALWLLIAAVFSQPVSATQSVVGATIGFTLVFHGTKGINWTSVIQIGNGEI